MCLSVAPVRSLTKSCVLFTDAKAPFNNRLAFGEPVTELPNDENDPLSRTIGEALWPERYTVDDFLRIKKVIGDYAFESLYQCHPTPKEGSFFKISNLNIIDAAPNNLKNIIFLLVPIKNINII